MDEDRAPLVAAIFDMYARRRVGSQAIANWLNDHGHRTQRGKPWGHTAVLTVLRNRSYLGEVFFRGTWHLAPHPPLVDAALFAEAQALLAERGEDVSKRASNPSEYLLSGVVVCAKCGKHYVGTAATGNVYRYRYYTCWSRNRYGTRTCDADRLPAEELDEAILRSLLQTFERRATFERACRAAAKQADGRRADLRKELKATESEIAKAEASIERYFHAFENGTMPEARCAERVNALGDRLVELRARRDELAALVAAPAPQAPSDETLALLRGHVDRVMKDGDEAQRKAVMQALVQEVRVVSRDEILPTFRVPDEHCATQVRIDDGIVGRAGIEPATEGL